MNYIDIKKLENVVLPGESTWRKMSTVRLTVLRLTNSKILGVSFDTSLYTSLKFIPRSYEKYVWIKQNALKKFFRNFCDDIYALNRFDNVVRIARA